MATERMCRQCGNSYVQFNKLQSKCHLCAYNLHAKPKQPLKRIGKVTKQWIATRKAWIDANPSDGIWLCYLCDKELTIDELQLDHIQSRTRRPDLRFDYDNLAPCCSQCNEDKGSLSLEQYALKKAKKSVIVDD